MELERIHPEADDESPSCLAGGLNGLRLAGFLFHCDRPAAVVKRGTDISAKSRVQWIGVERTTPSIARVEATQTGVAHTVVSCTKPWVLTEGKVSSDLVAQGREASAPATCAVVSFGKGSSTLAARAGGICSVEAHGQQERTEHGTQVACSVPNFSAQAEIDHDVIGLGVRDDKDVLDLVVAAPDQSTPLPRGCLTDYHTKAYTPLTRGCITAVHEDATTSGNRGCSYCHLGSSKVKSAVLEEGWAELNVLSDAQGQPGLPSGRPAEDAESFRLSPRTNLLPQGQLKTKSLSELAAIRAAEWPSLPRSYRSAVFMQMTGWGMSPSCVPQPAHLKTLAAIGRSQNVGSVDIDLLVEPALRMETIGLISVAFHSWSSRPWVH